ncbi:uncharacterized protein MELLADRAFT_68993 [Melampsora larici-populina 98AG31]|uniref:Uncharacterized protein n=1 Tax=Melampsora larici-populina (strain 98AG31 / pathotype 3-4-7) TaxID=747676 RepID=F4S909_MELLP|nr:uncharacterized protein MELLADRAFT_68993 [Melampsora larici-populina 98AG31]EGF98868.1 hypothetical protein MELLADRAFT_68993 [Melampsora larici-populina 98AG31]
MSPLNTFCESNEGYCKDFRRAFCHQKIPVLRADDILFLVPSQTMSIKIYGNLTMADNSSITTTNCRRSRPTPPALPTEAGTNPVPIDQPQRTNSVTRRRRSSRIARRAELRNIPIYRRPLPSAYEDLDFWSKIRTLPPNLLLYLSPGWHPAWCTKDLLRQIIWHFSPNLRIPCCTLKAELIELLEYHVHSQYGAYYGI